MAAPSIYVEYQKLSDKWFDRWGKAMAAARVAQYPLARLASDVADCWIDGTYAALLPWVQLGLLNVSFNPAIPTLLFVVTAKNDQAQFVPVQLPSQSTGVQSPALSDPGGTKFIPSANVGTVVTSNGLLVVTLKNLGTVPATATADFYMGRVSAIPSGDPVAEIQVVWPG